MLSQQKNNYRINVYENETVMRLVKQIEKTFTGCVTAVGDVLVIQSSQKR